MEIRITGKRFEVTPAIRKYVEGKITRVEKYHPHIVQAHLLLEVERKIRHIAEVVLVGKGLRISAKEASRDMYSSVDLVLDKIEEQLKRHRSRVKEHGKRHKRAGSIKNLPLAEEAAFESKAAVPQQVVKVERFAQKPLSVEEAALELDLGKDEFIMFRNAETDEVNVVFRRKDGTFGLIEPD